MSTLICDGVARSCFHTQTSLSRSMIGSAGPPGGGSKQIAESGAPRHRPSVFDVQPDDLSTAGSCATALVRRHRTGSLGRVEVTDRDDMPLGLHDPRPEARRAGAVPGPSAAGVVHGAAGQRDAVSRAVARDKPVAASVIPR